MHFKPLKGALTLAATSALALGGLALAAPAYAAADSAGVCKLTSGTLNWALKDTWQRYIVGTAKGSNTPSGGAGTANSSYQFPLSSGSYDPSTGKFELKFGGSIHAVGHGGILDLTISSPTLTGTGKQGTLGVSMTSKSMETRKMENFGHIDMAAVTLKDVNCQNGTFTLSSSSVTMDSSDGFGHFYQKGEALANLTVNAKAEVAPASQAQPQAQPQEQPKEEAKEQPKEEAEGQPSGSAKEQEQASTGEPKEPEQKESPASDSNSTTAAPETAPQPTSEDASKSDSDEVPAYMQKVENGTFAWGLRSSFTNYIRGIAKGKWDLGGGVKWQNNQFVFPLSQGIVNTEEGTGNIAYKGSVHFTGHNGVLDLTISNPTLELSGSNVRLYLTVAASNMEGQKLPVTRSLFATGTLQKKQMSDGKLVLSAANLRLSAEGAKAFAGFYEKGEQLDGFTVKGSLVQATSDDLSTGSAKGKKGKQLANSGALGEAAGLIAFGSLCLGLMLVYSRRRSVR